MRTIETQEELGGRVRDARLASGLTQSALADQIGVDRSALVRIEGGDRRVTALELVRLGEALDVPISHLVHRSPEAITTRRASLDEESPQRERERFRLDARLESHLRDAESLRAWGLLGPISDVPHDEVATDSAARTLAQRTRRFIHAETGALPALADVAEAVGLYLLVADMDVDGASLTPEIGFGVAIVGGRAAPGRRRFTAAHEIGHHVLGDEYQSDVGVAASRSERERLIDAFATEFLLPRQDVTSRWETLPGDMREKLLRLAAEYRVSWSVSVQVVRDAQVISTELAARLRRQTPQLGDFIAVLGRGPIEDLPVNATGPQWQRAVVKAYVEGLVTKVRAVEMLHGALSDSDLPSTAHPAP